MKASRQQKQETVSPKHEDRKNAVTRMVESTKMMKRGLDASTHMKRGFDASTQMEIKPRSSDDLALAEKERHMSRGGLLRHRGGNKSVTGANRSWLQFGSCTDSCCLLYYMSRGLELYS